MNMIGIVTVLYNSESVLEMFYETLDKQTCKNFLLIAIDNNSSDNSVNLINDLSERVSFKTIVLTQSENVGVAKGNNIGIQKALELGCEYVLLSNNDISLEADCIENLLSGLLREKATMAVPKIYYYDTDSIIWSAGGDFCTYSCTTPHRGVREKDNGQYDRDEIVGYSSTCFMLIEKSVFDRVGLMDEKYFVYYDDSDFVWRAIREEKEKLVYIFSSKLWHRVSFLTGGSMSDFYIKHYYRNRVYFARKHFNLFQLSVFSVFLFLQYMLRVTVLYTKEQRKLYLKSCMEGWNMVKR